MQQLNLFAESAPVLPITYYPDFISLEQANELYQHCLKLEWQQNQIRMLGKTIPVPRLECIYGDAGCDYLYSNSVFLKPLTWTDNLANLKVSNRSGIPITEEDLQHPGGFWHWVWQYNVPVTIVEGVKKAGALLTAGYAAIAIPGVNAGYRTPTDEYVQLMANHTSSQT
ncbi:DUF3854 domain-containing protein [Nostoc flagelliforme]|uniref:DUF3854 domain-containing protein n=1 Tax=Nostoc flagelliforme TaxID=1306274 RepID=UPI000C2D34AB|nr:DUF3854 domain-containing protein [Nostoc flagelliforme]